MAGYQRHNFDTTYVQPQSDGGWGALARGFSNGYSMGKAIASSINQHNVSEANKEYDKAVENANTQTMKPEQAIDPELVKAGTPERTRVLSQSQMDNLSPEGKKYFEDFYAKQRAAGNTPEYKYDAGQRAQMVQQAGEVKDKAIRDSYLQYMGQDAYDDYKLKQGQFAEADFKKTIFEGRKNILDQVKAMKSDPQVGLQAAIDSGIFPKGTMLDPKTMIATTPDGKATQITPQMYNGFIDQYQMKGFAGLVSNLGEKYEVDTYKARVEGENQKPALARSDNAVKRFNAQEGERHHRTTENLFLAGLLGKGGKVEQVSDDMVNVGGVSIPGSYIAGAVDKDGNVVDAKAFAAGQKKYQTDAKVMGVIGKRLGVNLNGISPNLFKQMILDFAKRQGDGNGN